MAQPYVGEIRLFAGNFAPAGWMFCDGTLLSIAEYETLFQLIGTTYGGDGQSTYALPDLRGRVPMHQGNGYVLGERSGVEQVTLTQQQIPAHTHPFGVAGPGTHAGPAGRVLATPPSTPRFSTVAPDAQVSPTDAVGGSQPHDNMQPYLTLNPIISLFGIFPSPT